MLPAIACMIIKNEAKNIEHTIATISKAFDKIIIIDTGSTDNTLQLLMRISNALKNTQVCLDYTKWTDDYSAARNYSYSKLEEKCIVTWWDGDDEPSPNILSYIRALKRVLTKDDSKIIGYHTVLRKAPSGAVIDSFDNGERLMTSDCYAGWCYPVHEQINFKGSLDTPKSFSPGRSGIYIYHPNSITQGKHLQFYEKLIRKGHIFCLHDNYFLLRELCMSNTLTPYWIEFLNGNFKNEFKIRPQDQPIYYLQCLEEVLKVRPEWFKKEELLHPLMVDIFNEASLWLPEDMLKPIKIELEKS